MKIFSKEQIYEADQQTLKNQGISSTELMDRAGSQIFNWIHLRMQGAQVPIHVFCGIGNNGGDGYVIARRLELFGMRPNILLIGRQADVTGDARINLDVLQASGLCVHETEEPGDVEDALADSDWVIDCLLGTGARGTLRAPFHAVIDAVNRAAARTIAIDLPSGLDCDTGESLGACVQASDTITFVAPKLGFRGGTASSCAGRVHVVDIGVPRAVLKPWLVPAPSDGTND